MYFKAKLNLKFYIMSALLLSVVVLGWYTVFNMSTNEILPEDNTVMSDGKKNVFLLAICVVLLSWTLSLFTLIRQIVSGYAFYIDQNGIHSTATAFILLAFIVVVPVKTIPFSAIETITEENGILTLRLNKSEIDTIPILKIFVNKEYRLFSGFTVEDPKTVKSKLDRLR